MSRQRPDRHFVKSDDSEPVDAHLRRRDYLTPDEVKRLLAAARSGRHAARDHLMLLLIYRHGLRVSELIALRRTDLDLTSGQLWVQRLKRGLSTSQPLAGDELRALRRHLAGRHDALPWLFLSERGQPLTRQAVNYLLTRIAARAGLGAVHPHMLRHSCGHALAHAGRDLRLIQDYLGHRDPRHTARYTRTAAVRFQNIWR
ncbi:MULTISPECIES: tyrosine-type recombinase/integrase [Paracoccus]|uniref:tyrosine-type recombinase/integrase n=1 Tax=Paracoccus TaxID=265 RepID=UPI00254C7F70|nr:tyrosine-type recombinase/integrase [Paracoccus sp. SSJ]MDK8874741.1 tyrosine-type recombinase/integrase [Paracoccus sp. SSJ]